MGTGHKKASELVPGDIFIRDRDNVRIVVGDPYTFCGYRVVPCRDYFTGGRYGLCNMLPDIGVTLLMADEPRVVSLA